jgi:signal transduction histidine kinase
VSGFGDDGPGARPGANPPATPGAQNGSGPGSSPPEIRVTPPQVDIQPPKVDVQPPKVDVQPPKVDVQPGRIEPRPGASEPSINRPPWWPAGEDWPPRRPDGRPDWRQVRERARWGWRARGRRYGWARHRRRGDADQGWDEEWVGPPWSRPGLTRRSQTFGCLFGFIFLVTAGSILLLVSSVVLGSLGFVFGGNPPAPAQIAAFIVLGACVVGALIAGGVFRRSAVVLDDTLNAMTRIQAGDYAARVTTRRRSPLPVDELAEGFNTMAERLEVDERQRRSLLADVSHELRTPLAVLQGNLEALIDGVHPADEEHLGALLDETRVVSRLVDDLRTLALSESGSLALHPESTDLSVVVADVVASFRPTAEANGVSLVFDADDALPLLEIDPVRTREVLSNLVANALRYTPSGGSIRLRAMTEGGAWVRVEVTDTGSGIAADVLPHIFDRFWKSPESRGSGLGLPIARNLIEAQGGEIGASSEPGQGTHVWFRLPAGAPTG